MGNTISRTLSGAPSVAAASNEVAPEVTVRFPSLLDYFRAPPAAPDGMVCIATPRDGTAIMTQAVATSISPRYAAAFTNGMRETHERLIREDIDMPRGTWSAVFSALVGVSAVTYRRADHAVAVLALLDYIDPFHSFLTASGHGAVRALAHSTVRSLRTLCERPGVDTDTLLAAFTWAHRVGDVSVRTRLATQLVARSNDVGTVIRVLDKKMLLVLLQEAPYSADERHRILQAWADHDDEATLRRIFAGHHVSDDPKLGILSTARRVGAVPAWTEGARRVYLDAQGFAARVFTRAGELHAFGASTARADGAPHPVIAVRHLAPFDDVVDWIVSGETQVILSGNGMPRGARLAAVILRPGAPTINIYDERLCAVMLRGAHFAEGYDTGVIRMRNLTSCAAEDAIYRGLDSRVRSIDLSDKLVCGVATNDQMRVWDKETGASLLDVRDVAGHCLFDDGIVVRTYDGVTTLYAKWETQLIRVRQLALPDYEGGFVSDGEVLFGASQTGALSQEIEMWDLRSGARIGVLQVAAEGTANLLQRVGDGVVLGTNKGEVWHCTAQPGA